MYVLWQSIVNHLVPVMCVNIGGRGGRGACNSGVWIRAVPLYRPYLVDVTLPSDKTVHARIENIQFFNYN